MAHDPVHAFVCYRRGDIESAVAGRIADELRSVTGLAGTFVDIANIPVGVEWESMLFRALSECKIFVLLVGKQWVAQELFEPDDWVRREIQVAVSRGVHILPIILDGASPLAAADLPEDLRYVAQLQAMFIDSRSEEIFRASMGVVLKRVSDVLKEHSLIVRNQKSAELKLTRPYGDLPNGSLSYTWELYIDGELSLTLSRGETERAILIPVGERTLRIDYDEYEHHISGPQGGAPGYASKGQSAELRVRIGPGKYEFSMRTEGKRTIWQGVIDLFMHNDSSSRRPYLVSYEPWEDIR